MFPLTRSWYQVSVGPLLAKSPAELVFLSMVMGNIERGTVSRIGLIRVSTLSAPAAFNGEELGRPLLGEIEVGDLSKWTRWHQPVLERHVRLAFPETHLPQPAAMYDYRTLNYIACVPALVGHLMQTDSPDPSHVTLIPATSDGNTYDNTIEKQKALDVTPRSIVDNPLMKSLACAYAAAHSQATAPISSSTHVQPSISTFTNKNTSSSLPHSDQSRTLIETPTYREAHRQQLGDPSYASIASVLDQQHRSSHVQNSLGQNLFFASVSDPRNAHLFDPYAGC